MQTFKLEDLPKEMQESLRLLEEVLNAGEPVQENQEVSKFPLTNIGLDTNGSTVVQIAIPGMSRENIDVQVEGNTLRVIGTPTITEDGEAIKFDLQDIVIKHFVREIFIHDDFLGGEMEASVCCGVLTIVIDQYQEPIYIIPVQ